MCIDSLRVFTDHRDRFISDLLRGCVRTSSFRVLKVWKFWWGSFWELRCGMWMTNHSSELMLKLAFSVFDFNTSYQSS